MTKKQREEVLNIRLGKTVEIGQVTVRKDRGQYNVIKGSFVKTYKDSEFAIMEEKIDELNTEAVKIVAAEPFAIAGTSWIGIKSTAGYDIYEGGKIIHKGLNERDFQIQVDHHKSQLAAKEVEKVRKNISKDFKTSGQKKTLYYFILILSAILLGMVYILGVKFDGVNIKRDNNILYETINAIATEKYPEKKSDKFDAVYYTLNYYAHEANYLMTEKVLNDESKVLVDSLLRKQYVDQGLDFNLANDFSYSGHDFNLLFKDHNGKFVNRELTYRYLGYIMGEPEALTIDDLTAAYKRWDANDVRVNKAYEWDLIAIDGTREFDTRVNYYKTYLLRNGFIKLFLNDTSKFIHEYILFESLGWLNWTSLVFLVLYIFLVIGVWIFRKDHIKNSKALITTIIILSILFLVPLVLQYFFEGLSKAPAEFLDVIENTKFTTTTTVMNFIFDYIMKFSNLVLTGILTVVLPMKVIRYFIHSKISKLSTEKTITKVVGPGTVVTEKISSADWRL